MQQIKYYQKLLLMFKQPWLGKPLTETVYILLPPFVSLLVISLFPGWFQNNNDMPDGSWVVLVLLIDVAHVYSTLYRTYFNRISMGGQQGLLWTVPFFSFIGAVLLYQTSNFLFWRLLAYLAVFHFIRQQYGFMRLYSRTEPKKTFSSRIDTSIIYAATLYPLFYWHVTGPKNFNWFIEGDFIFLNAQRLLPLVKALYILLIMTFLTKELYNFIALRRYNIPKLSIILGTLASWYFGIVYYNGDMAFTLLNVVSHGIPYMALIWIVGKKQASDKVSNRVLRLVFGKYGILLFLGLIFFFAFIEEGLWNLTLWKEHYGIFPRIATPFASDSPILNLIVPLLALPQITHYILDGFIWKLNKSKQGTTHPDFVNEPFPHVNLVE